MKTSLCLFALVSLALAGNKRGDYGNGYDGEGLVGDWDHGVTFKAYETTTVCPLTSTYTKHGSAYEVTTWTTSTITVTSCAEGNCGGVATTTAPPQAAGTTTEVDVTYTTVCPVTETITAAGSTYTTTKTTTSAYVTKIHTTIYETVTGPAVEKTTGVIAYTTLTSLCPVIETKTIGGSTRTVTWTSTSTLVTAVPTTHVVYTSILTTQYVSTQVYETITCPKTVETTVSQGSTVYLTRTNKFPITLTSLHTYPTTVPVYTTSYGQTNTSITYTTSKGVTLTTPAGTAESSTYAVASAPRATKAFGAIVAGVLGLAALI